MEISVKYVLTLGIGFFLGFVSRYVVERLGVFNRENAPDHLVSLKVDLAATKQQAGSLEKQNIELKGDNSELQKIVIQTKSQLAVSLAEKATIESNLTLQDAEIAKIKSQLTQNFELVSNRIFEDKSAKFAIQNHQALTQILQPLKERLSDFEKKVDETHTYHTQETTKLSSEIKHLRELGLRMSTEAENLTKALKNDTKTQGNWGEMILESILEHSGLRKGREYFVQQSIADEDGRRYQPDVRISLPGDKWIIIDSKVSLTAYEKFTSETEAENEASYLKSHMTSVRKHMKELSKKAYQNLPRGNNLDFILMFIPIEPAYLAVLGNDQSLFNESYEKKVILVSPSTLIAALKIIAATWKHEYQNRNAMEIAKRGKLLLDKFVGFTDDLEKIGGQLGLATKNYEDAMNKLRDGRGSLIHQAKQLEDLGLKPSKEISEAIAKNV